MQNRRCVAARTVRSSFRPTTQRHLFPDVLRGPMFSHGNRDPCHFMHLEKREHLYSSIHTQECGRRLFGLELSRRSGSFAGSANNPLQVVVATTGRLYLDVSHNLRRHANGIRQTFVNRGRLRVPENITLLCRSRFDCTTVCSCVERQPRPLPLFCF